MSRLYVTTYKQLNLGPIRVKAYNIILLKNIEMRVSIYPKHVFQQMLDQLKDKGSKPEDFDYLFISILDPDFREALYPDSDNYHTWWFYDLEYPIATYNPMSEEQGREIFEFIQKNKDKERCYVHCSAGVSRSGAVGEFVQDLLGSESYQDFKNRNKNIVPNLYVKKILNSNVK